MSQKQVIISKKEFIIHPYDRRIASTLRLLEKDFSEYNFGIVKKYDKELVNNSLAKATRLKHLQIILNLSRMIKKFWNFIENRPEQKEDKVIWNTENDDESTMNRIIQLAMVLSYLIVC